MQGVLQKTADVLQQISACDSIKDYTLIGGTALSLQINHRVSEDIDFCKWRTHKSEINKVNVSLIYRELSNIGVLQQNYLEDNHVDYRLNDVKITFFCNNRYKTLVNLQPFPFLNNIQLADINSIGILKLEALFNRQKFRDYYDFYSIIKHCGDFNKLIDGFLKYTNHTFRTRDVLAMLANGKRQYYEADIKHLLPKYQVSIYEISEFLAPYIANYNAYKVTKNK
jgi:predicted nucleotidyltransferase component of viral defense system